MTEGLKPEHHMQFIYEWVKRMLTPSTLLAIIQAGVIEGLNCIIISLMLLFMCPTINPDNVSLEPNMHCDINFSCPKFLCF
jgi:hypothetical protein